MVDLLLRLFQTGWPILKSLFWILCRISGFNGFGKICKHNLKIDKNLLSDLSFSTVGVVLPWYLLFVCYIDRFLMLLKKYLS